MTSIANPQLPQISEAQQKALENQENETSLREFEGRAVECKKYEGTSYSQIKAKNGGNEPNFYTMKQVAQHHTKGDAWVVVDDKVYDLSKYMFHHPGGSMPIYAMAGRDATDAFHNYHPAPVYKLLQHYYIGEVLLENSPDEVETRAFAVEHRALRQAFLAAGLFETKWWYYWIKGAWYATLLFASIYFTAHQGSTFLHRCFGAFLLACFFQQMAFTGHDLGHNSVTHKRNRDLQLGLICGPLLTGVSSAWWKHTHNTHHVACNSVDIDQDIQYLPLVAVTTDTLPWWRKKCSPSALLDSFARWMVANQGYTFWVLMAVARVNLYFQSILLLLTWPEKIPMRKLELLCMALFLFGLGYLLSFVPSNSERLFYLLISHGLAGILHIQIVVSHFAMPTYSYKAYNDSTDEWFKMQVRTSLNMDCYRWMDWFYGGLQFQVEHHLWPRIPRHNLRRCHEVTKEFCAQHNIQYNNKSFYAGVKEMHEHLCTVGRAYAKLPPKEQPGFFDSMIGQGLNAQG